MAAPLVMAVATLFLPVTARRVELTPAELGYPHRGRRGAMLTATAGSHRTGLIAFRPGGGSYGEDDVREWY